MKNEFAPPRFRKKHLILLRRRTCSPYGNTNSFGIIRFGHVFHFFGAVCDTPNKFKVGPPPTRFRPCDMSIAFKISS